MLRLTREHDRAGAQDTSRIPVVTGEEPRSLLSRALPVVGEAVVGVLAAAWLLLLSRGIDVDPNDRIGQVSALAGIGLRFTLTALVVVLAVVAALRWRGGSLFPLVGRLACAAVAGLTSGFVGSGVLVALRGSVWPLAGGDSAQLIAWVTGLQDGQAMPSSYPPLAIHLMSLWSDVTGQGAEGGVRAAQVLGAALFAPVVYLAWRLLLDAPWALAIGVTASLVLMDPYKPYAPVVLAVLIPVLLRLFVVLRGVASASWRALLVTGAVFGVGLGLLFLTYSGWFVWSAAGAVVGVLLFFPWRTGALRGLAFLGVTTVAFVAVSAKHLFGLLSASGTVEDTYFYFDVYVEPTFIAMWRGDLPGDTGPWPPPGELGGVGLFSVLLVIGLGLAVWLAGRRTVVIGLVLFFASAWVMRFWFAAQMYETQSVQLYPRTTQQILYCALLLVGFAVFFAVQRARAALAARQLPGRAAETAGRETPLQRRGAALLGVLASTMVLGLFAGSATADRYMPANERSLGYLAFAAQHLQQPDGTCPRYAGEMGCAPGFRQFNEWLERVTAEAATGD